MPLPTRPPRRLPESALGLALIAAALVAYAPALGGGLLWDDDRHLTAAALQGWDGLRRIWLELGATQQYYPVLHSAFWLEHRLWGDALAGYHLANAGLHALAACLVVLVAQRLAVRGAWLAGFLVALHPVNVESVAWITEQKNTLSLVLALLATLAWLRFDASRARRHWMAACALFALALAAKSVTATVPCAWLVIVWWRRGTISWKRDVAPVAPLLVMGVAAGLFTAWVERHVIGAEGSEFTLSAPQRVLVAGRAVWHYLSTYLWPSHLVFTYPRWTIDAGDVAAWAYPVAMLAITAALWRVRGRTRAPLAAWLAFCGMLFPVLGFLDVYPFRYSFVADHFQYQASIPLAMLGAAGVAGLHDRARSIAESRLIAISTCVVLVTCGVLTWRQAANYRDAETLYRATLAANPASWMAHHNLGRLVSRKPGGLPEAITHFEAAIRLKPDHARAQYSLGVALQRVGRAADAVPHLEAAIRYEPDNPVLVANAHYLIGDILRRDPTRLGDAITHLREAARRKPAVAEVHLTLGEALAAAGRVPEALAEYGEALRLQPGDAEAQRQIVLLRGAPPTARPVNRR